MRLPITEERGVCRVESSRQPGCRCRKPEADGGYGGSNKRRAAGQHPDAMLPT